MRAPGYVYLALAGGRWKIGRTCDLDNRRRQLAKEFGSTSWAHIIRTNDMEKAEKAIHKRSPRMAAG